MGPERSDSLLPGEQAASALSRDPQLLRTETGVQLDDPGAEPQALQPHCLSLHSHHSHGSWPWCKPPGSRTCQTGSHLGSGKSPAEGQEDRKSTGQSASASAQWALLACPLPGLLQNKQTVCRPEMSSLEKRERWRESTRNSAETQMDQRDEDEVVTRQASPSHVCTHLWSCAAVTIQRWAESHIGRGIYC